MSRIPARTSLRDRVMGRLALLTGVALLLTLVIGAGTPLVVEAAPPGPKANFSSRNVVFGNQPVGTPSAAQTITLKNRGKSTLSVTSVSLTGTNPGDFTISTNTCTGAALSRNSSCSVGVFLTPAAVGPRAASLSFVDNAPNSPQLVALSGYGTAPAVTLSTASLAFGSQQVGTTSAAQTVTVTNSGTTTLGVSGVTLAGANPGDFTKSTDTCTGANVAPGSVCSVAIRFAPTATGARSASLSFADNAADSPQSVALSGGGTASAPPPAPAVGLSPTSLTFNQQVGTTSAAQTVTVTNSGSATLTIASVGLTGANPGDFSKSADSCTGAAIAPNGTCTVNVTFTPTTIRVRTADLTFTDDAASSPQQVALAGTGLAPVVSLSFSVVDFGDQSVGVASPAQTVVVTNIGNSTLNVASLALAGANAGDYALSNNSCSGAAVAPGGTCSVDVTFTPAAAGTRTASLTLVDNASDSPQSVALTGNGTGASLSAAGLSFGSQQVGTTSAAQTVTVTNTDAGNLTITSVALTGANPGDFTTGNDTCSGTTVASGNTCSVDVAFAPTATGARAASLTFADNAADSPQQVALTGTGTPIPAPAVGLNPASLAFGSQQVGTTGAPQAVTLTNTGSADLSGISVTLAGANPGDFTKSTDTCTGATIPAGNGCSVIVAFAPTGTGARGAVLTIADNAANSPQSVALSGTGTAPAPPPATSGLQYYPLPNPVRLLDTRAGQSACDTPGSPLVGGGSRPEPARIACTGIPATARAIVGNATVVNPSSGGYGYVTLYPSDAQQPNASNLNYAPGQIVPNAFTVGLGADGAFKIYAYTGLDFIVDVTGYYAPPGAGGLYYHALPNPVRLLDTRGGQAACDTPGQPLGAQAPRTEGARIACTGIPAAAQAIVGNATVVNAPGGGAGYVTLWPSGAARPTVSNLNYAPGQIVPNAFTVGLGGDGAFSIYAYTSVDFVVDVTGYYSAEASDVNGVGLAYTPLASPVRLLDTRGGQAACDTPSAILASASPRTEGARTACTGIPAAAQAIVGNATVVNQGPNAGSGYVTLYPSGAAQPNASNLNYAPGQIVPNAFTVGLGSDGAFKIYAYTSIDFIVDVTGYFAP